MDRDQVLIFVYGYKDNINTWDLPSFRSSNFPYRLLSKFPVMLKGIPASRPAVRKTG